MAKIDFTEHCVWINKQIKLLGNLENSDKLYYKTGRKNMYEIIFEDKTKYQGGDPTDSKWLEIPNKRIAQIVVKITKPSLVLEGYEEYTLQNEISTYLKNGKKFLSNILFIGSNGKDSDILAFHLMSGKVFRRTVPTETALSTPLLRFDEKMRTWIFEGWTEPRKCTGWKEGLKSSGPGKILKLK